MTIHFIILSPTFLITFLSTEIAMSINTHVPFSLRRIMISGLMLRLVGSVCAFLFYNMVTLHLQLVSTHLGQSLYIAHSLTFFLFPRKFIIIFIIIIGIIVIICRHRFYVQRCVQRNVTLK